MSTGERARALVAFVASVLLLSGCTLVTASMRSEPPAATSTTNTPIATDGLDEVGATPETTPEATAPRRTAVDVAVSIGTPVSIEAADGSQVGTFTITEVDPYASCPNPDADENTNGTFVIVSIDISANESLAEQTDPYYGQLFDLSKLDVVDPQSDASTVGGPDYDCLEAGERLTTVQPGASVSGRLAFDVEDEVFAIRWFYGHQYFEVAPEEWGGA